MNKIFLAIGILVFAGLSFAPSEDPYVGSIFHKAWCGYDTYFDYLAGDVHYYSGGQYDGQMASIGDQMSHIYYVLLPDCNIQQTQSVILGGSAAYDYACLNANYADLVGYLGQAMALFFKAAVDFGVPWPVVLDNLNTAQNGYMNCLNGIQNN